MQTNFLCSTNYKCVKCGKTFIRLSNYAYLCSNCGTNLSNVCDACMQSTKWKCPTCKGIVIQQFNGCIFGISNSPFETWLESQGKTHETAREYDKGINGWRNSSKCDTANKNLFDLLPLIYKSNTELASKVADMLRANVQKNKFDEHKMAIKETSKKKRESATKRANTADNIVTYLNWYIRWAESCKDIEMTLHDDSLVIISDIVEEWMPIKNGKSFISTKLRNSLETQDRVYDTIKRWDDGNYVTFPIGLIKKIMGGRNGIRQWEDDVIRKTKVFTNKKEYTPFDIQQVQVIPYKKVLITVNGKHEILKTRLDENHKPHTMKAGSMADISIGHMPPLSEVLKNMMQIHDKLPALIKLTDIIVDYFNINGLVLNQKKLGESSIIQKIYDENKNLWTDDFKNQILADLKAIDEEECYELQDRGENSRMGGINRKK